MRVDIVTIFPEYFAPLGLSLLGRARAHGQVDITIHDLRDRTHDVHRTVDDSPYGGGPGMVMRPEPWGEMLDVLLLPPAGTDPAVAGADTPGRVRLIVPTPAGTPFTQAMAQEFAQERRLIFACGRYEGIDQRVIDHARERVEVSEVSIGDYVLFGGEVAVLVMMEAIVRLLPEVLGNADSLIDESHAAGLIEAPVFTKPPSWRGLDVPEILRSGDHGRIARWRREQALLRTAKRRPDLLAVIAPGELSRADVMLLTEAGFPVPGSDMAK